MDSPKRLSEFQQLLLSSLIALGGEGAGFQIFEQIREATKKAPNLGKIYAELENLRNVGYASSRDSNFVPKGSVEPRRYYRIEPAGERALREAIERGDKDPPRVIKALDVLMFICAGVAVLVDADYISWALIGALAYRLGDSLSSFFTARPEAS